MLQELTKLANHGGSLNRGAWYKVYKGMLRGLTKSTAHASARHQNVSGKAKNKLVSKQTGELSLL